MTLSRCMPERSELVAPTSGLMSQHKQYCQADKEVNEVSALPIGANQGRGCAGSGIATRTTTLLLLIKLTSSVTLPTAPTRCTPSSGAPLKLVQLNYTIQMGRELAAYYKNLSFP